MISTEDILPLLKDVFLKEDTAQQFETNHPEIALTYFFQWFGKERMAHHWIDEWRIKVNEIPDDLRIQLARRLAYFLEGMLESSFFHPSDMFPHISPHEIAQNTFLGYWTVLSYLNLGEDFFPNAEKLKDKFALLIKQTKPYKLNLKGQNLENINLSYLHLDQADFSYANLNKASLLNVSITNSTFVNADLQKANLSNANLSNCFLNFANLREAKMIDALFYKSVFHGADLERVDMSGSDLRNTNFDNANMRKGDFTTANFERSSLLNCDLTEAKLIKCNFNFALLNGATFKDALLYQAQLEQTELEETILEAEDLQKASFRGAILLPEQKEFLVRMGAMVEQK